MDICSEIEWYKLVQLCWPTASIIFDVGANKGYLGSLFLALWGGNGLGISPAVVFETATKLNTWKNSRNPAGYCRVIGDGQRGEWNEVGFPLFCSL